ncbi:MAG: HEPN domain-containing protein [Reichenbachiella sp.]|uniref:HEPN domain-containing protein n=1 Tax=Reichenbachiella sp. TaxID=2184521 RepID=UPI003267AA5A
MNKLPENLPQQKQRELDKITHLLMAQKAVEMVILFGSYAKGTFVEDRYVEKGITYEYLSDYDLLVVTTHDDLKQNYKIETELKQKLVERSLVKTPISLIFHSIKHLNQSLSEGSYFFQDIKKEGIFLYDSGQFQLQNPKKLSPAEARQKGQDYFDQWFKSANTFYEDYEHNYSKIDQDTVYLGKAAFMLHQATERYYTTILLMYTDYRPKEHDLERLDLRVRNCDARFDVFPRSTKEETRLFEKLRSAYVDARYKMDEYQITEAELLTLANHVQSLRELTEKLCLEKVERIGGEG